MSASCQQVSISEQVDSHVWRFETLCCAVLCCAVLTCLCWAVQKCGRATCQHQQERELHCAPNCGAQPQSHCLPEWDPGLGQ